MAFDIKIWFQLNITKTKLTDFNQVLFAHNFAIENGLILLLLNSVLWPLTVVRFSFPLI